MSSYDIIGDVHGSLDKLTDLLHSLGYRGDIPQHPDGRQAVFVGDLIDRGPAAAQLAIVRLVAAMVSEGSAIAVMGNHEFNALAYATPTYDGSTDYCRSHHNRSNRDKHAEFLSLTELERQECYDFFYSMPLWVELDGVRVIHACWHQATIDEVAARLGGNALRGPDDIRAASDRSNPLFGQIEFLLKGPEVSISYLTGAPFYDKEGTPRHGARLRWWKKAGEFLIDFVELGDPTKHGDDFDIAPLRAHPFTNPLAYDSPIPVVFGHYWRRRKHHDPEWAPHVDDSYSEVTACVDFSAGGDGPLVAYRFNSGDVRIHPENYVVGSLSTPSSASN